VIDIIALRSDLAAWLGHLLGNYRAKNGATFPAIYLGEPPSDYVFEVGAGGERLEVIVDAHQQGTVHRVHGGQRLEVSATIRLIPHGRNTSTDASAEYFAGAAVREAAQIIVGRLRRVSDPLDLPANAELGVVDQSVIQVFRGV